MPPRARQAASGPEFLTSATLGELIAAELETIASPPAPTAPQRDGDPVSSGAPALTPTERARRSMLNRAAAEIREHHRPADPDAD